MNSETSGMGRKQNLYFIFLNEVRKNMPKNIKMSMLNRMASEMWRAMPETKKDQYRRLYQENRDKNEIDGIITELCNNNRPNPDGPTGGGYDSSGRESQTVVKNDVFMGYR